MVKQLKLTQHQAIITLSASNKTTMPSHKLLEISDDLSRQGFSINHDFLSNYLVESLAIRARLLENKALMRKAVTGSKNTPKDFTIRGDNIHWIEKAQASKPDLDYLDIMAELQNVLNQELFLGLFEFETHFAIYPAGAGYQKHLDQLVGKEERKVSCILYLNDHWKEEDGGQLRLYLEKDDPEKFIDILPQGGTLVIFLSADFLHEVLPAKRNRISITGWFRSRALDQ